MSDTLPARTPRGAPVEPRRGSSDEPFAPTHVLVALTEAPRTWEDFIGATDRDALAAAQALAAGLDVPCERLHVAPDDDGVTRADVGLAAAVAALPRPILVLGSRSSRRAGTTARGLLADPPCPLWIQRGRWAPVQRVVAAVERPAENEPARAVASRLAASLGADLVLLHFTSQPVGAIDEGVVDDGIVVRGPDRRAIEPHLVRADLIVLGRGRRRGLGWVLDRTVQRRTGPFVVVP